MPELTISNKQEKIKLKKAPSVNYMQKGNNLYGKKYAYIYILPGTLVLALLTLGPFIYTLVLSFTDKYLATTKPTEFAGLDNYIQIFTGGDFWTGLLKTIFYVLGSVSVELFIGFAMALLFQLDFKGKRVMRSIIIMPLVAMPIAIAYIWRIIFNPNVGILNYLLSFLGIGGIEWISSPKIALLSVMLVDIWQWTPFIFLILSSGISALPHDPFEAAVIDGANFFQVIKFVLLPHLKPIISIALIFRFVDAFKSFDLIYILTGGGPGNATETLNVHTYLNAFKYMKMGYASAMSIIMIILIITISKYVVKSGDFNLE